MLCWFLSVTDYLHNLEEQLEPDCCRFSSDSLIYMSNPSCVLSNNLIHAHREKELALCYKRPAKKVPGLYRVYNCIIDCLLIK